MEYYLSVIKNYAKFDGRARRKEYWMFNLINLLIYVALAIVDGMLLGMQIVTLVYGLAILIPSFAVGARRLHDIGKTGWWQLLAFVPLGVFVLLFFVAKDGEMENNQYGVSPKYKYKAQVHTKESNCEGTV